ncbi:uroporphyrinogen-III C-methyltransferase [Reichenbachiella versicolor]|uniref:uroporphyrinogen-III C-methyltransferase n=1 Tax=Reichenbachiella versicolor TaxID=1821036 RepID=UPI000D6E018D|nr:uroporphyrinogen-III C-methyltransferase [Reichenbachiella versicolor]
MGKAKLTLVGAGPGDPGLFTLKGVEVLKSADVVLYDALANEELLNHCGPNVKKIFVGKRASMHAYQQDKINEMIVEHAKESGHVVRLKGGDPYVFGRGHEELEFAEKHGIEVDLVPGVTSAISVPALNQIPLTRRGINDSFWVMTAVRTDHTLSQDIGLAAQSQATSVILMGVKKLPEIVEVYKSYGKENTPAAVIMNGSKPNQKIVIGRVNNINSLVVENEIGAPSIIVIGETVALGEDKLKKEIESLNI